MESRIVGLGMLHSHSGAEIMARSDRQTDSDTENL
jgi:hypothetical protein